MLIKIENLISLSSRVPFLDLVERGSQSIRGHSIGCNENNDNFVKKRSAAMRFEEETNLNPL